MAGFIAQFFSTTPDGPVFFALAIIWILFSAYWACAFFYDIVTGREKPRLKSGGSLVHEVVPRLIITLAVVIVVAEGSGSALVARLIPGPDFVSYIGVGIAAVGCLFAIWARYYLGSNWSLAIEVKKGHTLVRTGPYAIVRHPIYTGIGFGLGGSALALANAFGILVFSGAVLLLFFRMGDEEKLMVEQFGEEYREYEGRVKRVIPFVY